MASIEIQRNKLRCLKQYKDLSNEELDKIIAERDLAKDTTFASDEEEIKFKKQLLKKYLEEKSFESASEKETLNQLLDLEILSRRLKKFIDNEWNKLNTDGTQQFALPTHMIEKLHQNNAQITSLKNELGLGKKDEQQDWIAAMKILEQKALAYYEEHKGCNTVKCPECGSFFNMLFDASKYQPVKATWWKGTILYNKKLFELFHSKKLTKEEISECLGVSDYYIDMIYEEIYLKELSKEKK